MVSTIKNELIGGMNGIKNNHRCQSNAKIVAIATGIFSAAVIGYMIYRSWGVPTSQINQPPPIIPTIYPNCSMSKPTHQETFDFCKAVFTLHAKTGAHNTNHVYKTEPQTFKPNKVSTDLQIPSLSERTLRLVENICKIFTITEKDLIRLRSVRY
jgi:hypothetical protein